MKNDERLNAIAEVLTKTATLEGLNKLSKRVETLEKALEPEVEKGEHCQICGNAYLTIYRVPDEIWNEIKPEGKQEGAGLLCISCADRLTRSKGYELYWSGIEKDFPKAHKPELSTLENENENISAPNVDKMVTLSDVNLSHYEAADLEIPKKIPQEDELVKLKKENKQHKEETRYLEADIIELKNEMCRFTKENTKEIQQLRADKIDLESAIESANAWIDELRASQGYSEETISNTIKQLSKQLAWDTSQLLSALKDTK